MLFAKTDTGDLFNPTKPTDMLKLCKFALLLVICTFAYVTHAQPTPATTGQLTAEDAKRDTRVLMRALKELHPALTKYRTPAEMDAAFAKFEARGNAARDAGEMYLAASELAVAIRCGHTWTNVLNQTGAVKTALLDSANKLPVTMTLVEGRWLVLASTDAGVKAGDEILAVNGVTARDMVARLMPYLRADGSSDGKRLVQLNHDRLDFSQMDILWPLLSPPLDGRYQLAIRRGNATQTIAVSVGATTLDARNQALVAQGVLPIDKTWKFRIENNVGILTMPNFVFWNSDFDWAKFIDDTFAELNAKKVPNLVIDIRVTEGGGGGIDDKIISHLIDKPYRYAANRGVTMYERVPYNLVKYLDTWDYSFFDRTGQVEKITEGTAKGKWMLKSRVNGEQIITPAATRYAGRTYMLVSAENSSATFIFANLAKRSGTITLVGQVTGGNQRGLNGGEMTWVTLPNSGVSVDIPLLAASYNVDTPDASVTPDIVVTRTFAARAAGRDVEMEAVMRVITGK